MNSLYKVSKFPHIRYLNAKDNRFEDLKMLNLMSALLAANFGGNRITKLCPLDNKFLQVLDLTGNALKNFSGLKSPSLTYLIANRNRIGELGGLQLCPSLQRLDVCNNTLKDLSSVTSLASLRELRLAGNKISSLAGLENLPSLEILDLQRNELVSTVEITTLSKLEQLDLSFNAVEAFEEITRLNKIQSLRVVVFEGNPVADVAQFRENVVMRIPQLNNLDGEIVTRTDRDAAQKFYEEQMTDM